jgi:hypothetical protein
MGGLFVETESLPSFKKGDELSIAVKNGNREKPIQAKCRVTRVTDKGIGIEFAHITLQDAWDLIMETGWESDASR